MAQHSFGLGTPLDLLHNTGWHTANANAAAAATSEDGGSNGTATVAAAGNWPTLATASANLQLVQPQPALSFQQHIFAMEFGLDQHMVVRSALERVLVVFFFVPLMAVGILGNFWLIWSVVSILSRKWFPINLLFRQIALYIFTLSIVDLMTVFSIPMLLVYMLTGTWHFGTLGCKLFFGIENVNKLLSVMVLAVMSVERFIAVCRPLQWLGIRFSQKRLNSAFLLLACLLATVSLFCAPTIYYASVNHYMLMYPDGSMELGATTCSSVLPEAVMKVFICYMCLFGFIIPLPLIGLCYFFIIQHIRRKPNGFVASYTARAVRSIFRVVLFHFICWTPFWLFVSLPLISHFQLYSLDPLLDSPFSKLFRMATSFLPYLNSSLNWVFYGVMNRQLRDQSSGCGTLLSGHPSFTPLSSLPARSASASTSATMASVSAAAVNRKRRSVRSLLAFTRLSLVKSIHNLIVPLLFICVYFFVGN